MLPAAPASIFSTFGLGLQSNLQSDVKLMLEEFKAEDIKREQLRARTNLVVSNVNQLLFSHRAGALASLDAHLAGARHILQQGTDAICFLIF
jgi:hypothetical protein